jgi:aspartyl-tRNA(Asn)/glutamyl-tRNA(Gln) amidotransferase subunit B
VFEKMAAGGGSPAEIVQASGLAQISGEDELTSIVKKVIASNEKVVADFRAGKESAINALVGPVMKETGGRANFQVVRALLLKELDVNA